MERRSLLVLGIETTCDETGVAIVEDGYRILSNQVLSQVPLHERFGGVVPEIASRAHVEAITRLIEKALREAGIPPEDAPARLDLIAVAHRPGLIGSLLVGLTAAKCLALAWEKPIIGVDHIHAHIYSSVLRLEPPWKAPVEEEVFPAVSLVISGGHSAIYASEGWTSHRLIGATTDDAAGEAFDKAAAILGLGYPGGPAISRAAAGGDRAAVRFPRTLLDPDSLDFSFSGIKTAVLYHVKGQNSTRGSAFRPGIRVADVAAAFEEAVVDVIIEKLRRAVRRESAPRAIVSGGVAANQRLRQRLRELSEAESLDVLYPDPRLCTDNAAMIAGLGCRLRESGVRHDHSLDAYPLASALPGTGTGTGTGTSTGKGTGKNP